VRYLLRYNRNPKLHHSSHAQSARSAFIQMSRFITTWQHLSHAYSRPLQVLLFMTICSSLVALSLGAPKPKVKGVWEQYRNFAGCSGKPINSGAADGTCQTFTVSWGSFSHRVRCLNATHYTETMWPRSNTNCSGRPVWPGAEVGATWSCSGNERVNWVVKCTKLPPH